MPPQILEVITKVDNAEIIRDQIAAILALELGHQATLSGDPMPAVFIERSNVWGQFLATSTPAAEPVINVWWDSSTFDEATSNVVERQRSETVYNIDCYGYGTSQDDGGAGHLPGDERAARQAQRAVRLARNILMAAPYTYLGLRGLVWKRFPQTISLFQPQIDNRAAQRIVGARLALRVDFNEFAPQIEGATLEAVAITFFRKETGQVLVQAEYPSTP